MRATFHGVRGSTPCSCDSVRRYGGNTSCVALEVPGEDPILLDLGTGARAFGQEQPDDGTFSGVALLSHLHWDHVQGLPFLTPVDRPGARLDIYGPPQVGTTLAGAFDELMRPPFFPIRASELRGEVTFSEVGEAELAFGTAKVRVRPVPHVGPTNGYRIEWDGATVAYVSDHQAPLDGGLGIDPAVLELCDGVDLLVHDAQYTPEEWRERSDWGHSSVDYAVHVAREAGVRRLALFHHDPGHDDAMVDRLLEGARTAASGSSIEEVLAAADGLTVSLDR